MRSPPDARARSRRDSACRRRRAVARGAATASLTRMSVGLAEQHLEPAASGRRSSSPCAVRTAFDAPGKAERPAVPRACASTGSYAVGSGLPTSTFDASAAARSRGSPGSAVGSIARITRLRAADDPGVSPAPRDSDRPDGRDPDDERVRERAVDRCRGNRRKAAHRSLDQRRCRRRAGSADRLSGGALDLARDLRAARREPRPPATAKTDDRASAPVGDEDDGDERRTRRSSERPEGTSRARSRRSPARRPRKRDDDACRACTPTRSGLGSSPTGHAPRFAAARRRSYVGDGSAARARRGARPRARARRRTARGRAAAPRPSARGSRRSSRRRRSR